MNPDARGFGSYAMNEGSVFPDIIIGTLLPSSSCWPNMTATCEWFTFEPFAPVTVIILKLLAGNLLLKPSKASFTIFDVLSEIKCLYYPSSSSVKLGSLVIFRSMNLIIG